MIFFSDRLTQALATRNPDEVRELADGNCTAGYDNDGSTGTEIFENGVQLGLKLALVRQTDPRADLYGARLDDPGSPDSNVFVIASSEAEAVARILSWPAAWRP